MYIPENSLKDEIQELIEICRILEAEEGIINSKWELDNNKEALSL